MLNSAYSAIEQFQRKKSSIATIQELKVLLKRLNLPLNLKITSSSFWEMQWNLLENTLSGTLEIGICPIVTCDGEILQPRNSKTLRVESSEDISMTVFENQLIKLIGEGVDSIW